MEQVSQPPVDSKLLAEAAKKLGQSRLYRYTPYPWQEDFHNAGADNPERMLMAANRVGKTLCAGAEVAMHLTGDYPDWWEGWRSEEAVLCWVGSVTNEASRDIVQKELMGGLGEELGTGWIPRDAIIGSPQTRQAGISGVVDRIRVRHRLGGVSTCIFKTYDQGWRKWQGAAPHVVWLDEEPDENASNEKKIFSEALTRVLSTRGRLIMTFTPLLGETELVRHFASGIPGTYLKTATWADAPHLDPDETVRLMSSYPAHELEARSRGIPMMGEGRVWAIPEDELKVAPFEIPKHFFRICGLDFGIDHPAANAWLAHDRDRDIVYVYDVLRKKGMTPDVHVPKMNKRGTWIPVAWPHDGMNRGKADGTVLHAQYRKEGAAMLSMSARYDKDVGGAQPVEPVLMDMLTRMMDGRFKVFSDCGEWFEEFRSYHRKDGKVVAVRDDILKATQYAMMMLRYARQDIPAPVQHGYTRAVVA